MSGKLFHAPFLNLHPGFQFRAVAERHQKQASGRYPNVISYTTADELLGDPAIELVVVNTPNYLHYEHARAALNAGKHVLIEKPATATVDEVMDLFETGKRLNRQVLVYQNRRWDSDFLSVKEVVESGRLGNLVEAHFRFDRYRQAIGPKRFKESAGYAATGQVYDLGPHLLDQVISLFGKPVSFHKTTATHREGSEVADYFSYQLTYPYRLQVTVTASLTVVEPGPAFVLHGTAGSYFKQRTDVQEPQLLAGLSPADAAYGIEPAGSEGRLFTIQGLNDKLSEAVPSCSGNYMPIFDAVHHTIRNHALYPVTDEHIAWQLEMLQA